MHYSGELSEVCYQSIKKNIADEFSKLNLISNLLINKPNGYDLMQV